MYSRLVVPLVCAAAIVFACGPRTRTTASGAHHAARGATARRAHRVAGHATRDSVATWFDVVEEHGGGVRLALHVLNQTGKRLEIDFPNGHTRDFVVLDPAGKEVWRWSKGRLFTQTVQNRFLAAGDTADFEARWPAPSPGTYVAVGELRSRNFPAQARTTFTITTMATRVGTRPAIAALVP